jgi:hypothetical protein
MMKHARIRKPRRGIAGLAVAVIAAAVSIGIANPASAAVRGLNLQVSGCDYQAPGTSLVLRAHNVYGWKCFTGFYDLLISVNAACRYTYGSGSSAYYLNYSDPYSWRCR